MFPLFNLMKISYYQSIRTHNYRDNHELFRIDDVNSLLNIGSNLTKNELLSVSSLLNLEKMFVLAVDFSVRWVCANYHK